MISEIFLDMDGVISDFKKRYKEVFKADPEEDYNAKTKKRKVLHQKRFREFIYDGEFLNLEPMEDLQIGLDYIKSLNLPTCILTSTATEEYIHILGEHKKLWLNKYNIPYNVVLVPGKRLKYYYSKSNRLLIDDTLSTVESWILNGGFAIRHLNWESSIEQIKEFL